MRENLSSGICKHQRRRPACASAQSDQRLCYSLIKKNNIYTCYERKFKYLASLWCRAGWFESHFVGNPEDRFSASLPIKEWDITWILCGSLHVWEKGKIKNRYNDVPCLTRDIMIYSSSSNCMKLGQASAL